MLLSSPQEHHGKKQRRLRRLFGESLERRQVLATFIVTLPGDSGPGTLRQAIVDANTSLGADTITFDSSLSGESVLLVSQLPTITEELTITGPGAEQLTIDAGGGSDNKVGTHDGFRHFYINDGDPGLFDVTISGLTLAGGDTTSTGGDGGAIRNHENLTLSGVAIKTNAAPSRGGGIHHRFGRLEIDSSTLTGNASARGGGISISANAYVTNSTVSGNSASLHGGGISVTAGSLHLTSSALSGNSATLHGGGISTEIGSTYVTSSTLSGNSAGIGGGMSGQSGIAHVTSSTISGNWSYFGGAIYNKLRAYVNSSTLSGNSAYWGGGINHKGVAAIDVTGSTISDNSASENGGGIHNSAIVSVTTSTISDNSASQDGGGIHNNTRGSVSVTSSTLSGNLSSQDGGGIYNGFGTASVINSTLSGNSATYGGGVYNSTSGILSVSNSTLSVNVALSAGGGVRNSGTAYVSNSIVSGNAAPGGGNVFGMLTTDDFNLIDIVPMLAPLADNGGPTLTHALRPDGPAINSGDPASVAGVDGTPSFDQRGPGFLRVDDGQIDIGAFELVTCDFDGDFNGDGACDGKDIDLLQENIVNGPANPQTFDLDGNGVVDINDRDIWLAGAGAENLLSGNPYLLGDANLDGVVDGQDFVAWNANKFTNLATWSGGDFNVDGVVNGRDFMIWNANKFTSADSVTLVALGNHVRSRAPISVRHSASALPEHVDSLFAKDEEDLHDLL